MNADELAQSIRSKHDKLETDCKQTVLAVELVALQMKLAALTARVAQLEQDDHERTQTQDAKHERPIKPR
jgi:outer membrane murein-binding lipoprotein Lpp